MPIPEFGGSITALITPFARGHVDEEAFRRHIEWQIEQGTHGLVPAGTTGESPTLSHEEHQKIVEICISQARGRVPVIAGAGSNNTQEAIELSRHAERAGADALLHVTPYYNRPTQEGLYEHFKAIDSAVGIPIILYNIPSRSVVDLSVETMARCAELKHVIGVKDATGDMARISLQRAAIGPHFVQLSGNDITNLSCMAAGAHGSISVVANIAPRLCADLHTACLEGDYAKAREIQDRLTPLCVATFLEPGIVGVKAALHILQGTSEEVRLPLTPASASVRKALEKALQHAHLLSIGSQRGARSEQR